MFYFKGIISLLRPSKPHYERSPLPISSSKFVSQSRKKFLVRTLEGMFDICEKYVFFDRELKLYLYFLLGTILAFLGRLLEPLPKFCLTEKRNPLNDYVVKLGLLWTSVLLLPFIFFTSKVYSGSDYIRIFRQLSRLLVSFLFWYVTTAVFFKVENWTGICSLTVHDSRSICLGNGGNWFAFEISGHCFLLAYCSLIIAEELLVFRHWRLIPQALKRAPLSSSNDATKLNDANDMVTLGRYRSYTTAVRILFVLSAILILLWDVMFLITNLYYHTWLQNICGLAFAGVGWYLTYGLWYRMAYSPGMPGESKLKKYIDSKWKTLAAAD